MNLLNNWIFETIPVKYLKKSYSKEDAFKKLASQVDVTNKIPVVLHKRSSGTNQPPYFTGIVNSKKNKIELMYKPTTNIFIHISAKINDEGNNSSTVEYQIYQGGQLIFYRKILFLFLVIFFLMPWKFLAVNPLIAGLFAGTILMMSMVRMVEVHKIIRDKRISISLKLQRFFSLGLLSFFVLLAGTCILMVVQNGKVIWQIPLVMTLFFAALIFLKRFGGNKFQEEKFIALFN